VLGTLLVAALVAVTVATWNWTVALLANPVVLIIMAIIALVVAIVLLIKNWDKVEAWLKSVWNAFLAWAKAKWDDFRNFWVGLWDTVWKWCSDRITDIRNFIVNLFTAVVSWVQAKWNGFLNFWRGLWDAVREWARQKLEDFISFVRSIPGRVMSLFSDAGSWLLNAGRSIIQGLWNGISSMVGWIKDKVSGVLGSIRNLLPFSPAREGPFSGKGWVLYSGLAIGEALGQGIIQSGATAVGAARRVLGAVHSEMMGSPVLSGDVSLSSGSMALGGNALSMPPIQFTLQMNPRDVQMFLREGTLRYAMQNNGNGYTPGLATGGR